jgi:TrpR-related protein YerC/YecD
MDKFAYDTLDNFLDAVLRLKTKEECRSFFEDVCTIKELGDMSQRLEVATQLKAGRSYQEISRNTGASTATISRVNRCLNYGSGGYGLVLENSGDTGDNDEL